MQQQQQQQLQQNTTRCPCASVACGMWEMLYIAVRCCFMSGNNEDATAAAAATAIAQLDSYSG